MKDVFISYSSADSELAHQLRDCVEREGHSCWMAPDDIKGPKTFAEQILEAIRASGAMIVVMSDGANASDHMPREVSLASDGNTPIVPVRVEDVLPTGALQYLLQLRQWVDAFPGPIEDHVDSLKDAIEAVFQQGGDTPVPGSEQQEAAMSAAAAPGVEYLGILSRDESSTVWRAYDAVLGRDISVRELRVPEGMSPEEVSLQWERIERGITKAACLKHPSMGEVYRAWRTGDRFMVSAELLEGETLETRLSLGPLPPKTALALLLQIASAVSYTHRKGVAHAGVRPWNVFLTPAGQVRLAGGNVPFDPGVGGKRLGTKAATVDPMGSPGYLAPEQLKGSPPNELVDEFSLAVIANEMLTGRNAFGADTETGEDEIVRRTLGEPLPSVAASGIDFPQARAVDEVLARASAKDPAKRYPSVADFWTALREAWTSAPPVAEVVPADAAVVVAATAPAPVEQAAASVAAEPTTTEPVTPAPAPVEPVAAQVLAVASAPAATLPEPAAPVATEQTCGPSAVAAAKPRKSQRTRTVLIGSVMCVVAAGLLAGGFFALRGGGSDLPATKPSTKAASAPTPAELLGSASAALAAGDYSVATSEAAAAMKMDPSLEESAASVIAEAKRLAEIAEVKPTAETAFAKKDWSAAVTAYTRLVKLDPKNATFTKRLAEAKKQRELLRLYSLGRKYERAHNWSKAKRAYERVLAMDKKYRDAAKRLARAKAALNPPSASGGSSGGGSSGDGSSGDGSSGGGGEEF